MRAYACSGAAAVALLVALSAGAAARADAAEDVTLVNAVVASVDGAPITMADLDRFAEGQGRLLAPEERGSREALLRAMVNMRMFQSEYERNGITTSDEEVDAYIDHVISESHSTREQVRTVLDRAGVGWDQYFDRMRQEVQRLALINREIRARVNVSPEQVERYWKDSDAFVEPERVEIGDIFMPYGDHASAEQREAVRARADEAYRAAVRNFAKAARKYSQGPNADEGGVLGTFRRGTMAPMFERQLGTMSEGQVSQPFEAQGAMHLIKLVRVVAPERVPLEGVRERIEEQLYDEALESRFKKWVEEDLRKRHHITMQLDELADLVASADRS